MLDASGTYRNRCRSPFLCNNGGDDSRSRRGPCAGRELASRRILLTGHGHSAATALLALETLTAEAPDTLVTWVSFTQPPSRRDGAERSFRPSASASSRPPTRSRSLRRRGSASSARRRSSRSSTGSPGCLADARWSSTSSSRSSGTGRTSIFSRAPLEISSRHGVAPHVSRALANVTDCLSVPSVSPGDRVG